MASRAIRWKFVACAFIACGASPWASGATPAIVASTETLLAGHTCALDSGGRVYCWGHNGFHQLGQGSASSASSEVPAPVVGIPGSVTALATGSAHACAVPSDGSVWCWGQNDWGQLGAGTANSSTPARVPGLPGRAVAVGASINTSCAVDEDGTVQCWGFPNRPPYRVSGVTDAVAVSTGSHNIFTTHSCAVTRAGGVMCWDSSGPARPVEGLSAIVAIDVQSEQSCALSSSGQVSCWGSDLAATGVSGVAGARALGSGGCAALGDGTVRCWSPGQPARAVTGLSNVVALSTGFSLLCVIDTSAHLACRASERDATVRYGGFVGSYRSVQVGGSFVCAITTQGRAECAGANESGQLGRGTGLTGSTTPVALQSLGTGVRSVATGRAFGCAVTPQGGVKCWGSNNVEGVLGSNSISVAPTPIDISGLGGVQSVAAGDGHACALTSGGAVYCWGYIGGTSPYPIGGVSSGVAAIASGFRHACAVMQDGSARCWGDNDSGQLGNGNTSNSYARRAGSGTARPSSGHRPGFRFHLRVDHGRPRVLLGWNGRARWREPEPGAATHCGFGGDRFGCRGPL